MKRLNNKGFTLMEVLVAVAILGIITAMSLPVIRNIETSNENKKYTTYADSLLSSAKLYIDSYEEDLFGHEENGCIFITYENLAQKGFIKDIPLDGVSCNSEGTFIRVLKFNGSYSYSVYLGCGTKNGESVSSIDTTYPVQGMVYRMNSSLCGDAEGGSNIFIQASPLGEKGSYNVKARNVRFDITSALGINSGAVLYYAWSFNREAALSEISDWTKLDIVVPDKQKEKLLSGEMIQILSPYVSTPIGGDGDYYLFLRVDRLQTLSGKNWINSDNSSLNYTVFGPYRVDNIAPTFTATIDSSVIHLEANDNHSSTSKLKMCLSVDHDSCSKKVSDVKSYPDSFASSKTLDGVASGNHTIFITIGDEAGNYTTQSYPYYAS